MTSIFYETQDSRWEAIEKDFEANDGGLKRMGQITAAIDAKNGAPTNAYWEFITIILPQLVWQNPSLSITARVPGAAEYDGIGLRYALEAMMKDQGWNLIWEQVFVDALAWRGVSMVTTEDTFAPRYMDGLEVLEWNASDDSPKRVIRKGDAMTIPNLVYIHPKDFFTDSEVRTRAASRRMGHRWNDSASRLKAKKAAGEGDYDLDVIEAATRDTGDADLLEITQMFVPGYLDPAALKQYKDDGGTEKPGEDDLHPGTLYTMAGGKDILPPRVYRGPTMGPYQVYECVPLPGQRDRRAPMAAAYPQVDQDARVGEALTLASESYQRLVVATTAMAEALQSAGPDGIVSVGIAATDLKDAFGEVSVGGPSMELIAAKGITEKNKDLTLGISDAQRSVAQKGTTATADSIADKSTDIKVGFFRNPLHRSSEDQVSVAAWHVLNDPSFLMVVDDAARVKGLESLAASGQPVSAEAMADSSSPVVYTGGDALKRRTLEDGTDDGPDPRYDPGVHMIKFEPMSMERTSEHLQQKRIFEAMEMKERVLNMMGTFPGYDGKSDLEEMGQKLNMPGLGNNVPEISEQPQPQGGAIDPATGQPVMGAETGAVAAQGAV